VGVSSTGSTIAVTGSPVTTAGTINVDVIAVPTTALTGILAAAQEPAHTGDVTNSAGSLVLTAATVNSNVGAFTNANITVNGKGLVTAAANGSSVPAIDIQVFNASGTWTKPAGSPKTTRLILIGAGGGGGSGAQVALGTAESGGGGGGGGNVCHRFFECH
jgi:hypothetical protein